jgi:outer membrane protein
MATPVIGSNNIEKSLEIIGSVKSDKTSNKNIDNLITLEVAIYKSLLENHLIKASFHTIASRAEVIKKAESTRFGKLSFNIYGSKYNDSISAFIGKDQAAARNINYDFPIYTGGAIKSAINQARLGSQIARYESDKVIQEVAAQTIEGYLNLLQAQWLIAVGEEYIEQTNLQLKLVDERIKAGDAVKSDKLRVEVAQNQAKLNLISARNFRLRAISALNLVMAGRLKRELYAVPPQGIEISEESLEQGLARAKIKRPELMVARSALKILNEELATAKSKLKPTLGLNMVYGDLNSTFIGETDSAQLTIGASFPLYQGGGLRADVHEAQNAIKAQTERLKFFEESSDFEVTLAHIDMSEARERMAVALDNISSSRENARIVQERYKAGTSIVLEMVDANLGLLNAKTQVLKNLIGYFISSANYYKTSGEISRFFNEDLRNRIDKRSPTLGLNK